MPRAITYNCDICGAQRKEANHWFISFRPAKDGLIIKTWDWAAREGRLDYPEIKYLCGQSCAHKQLDQFLQSTSEFE